MIQFENIRIDYQGATLLDNFSAIINKGEKIALRGASGSGKSTLLSMIMGFECPNSGKISVAGMEVSKSNIDQIRKIIAFVPQEFACLGAGTVAESIFSVFNLNANKNAMPKQSEIDSLANQLLLDSKIMDTEFAVCSGGEKQRIGILIALLMNKPILLLDEPTSALDAAACAAVTELVLANKEQTVVAITHDDNFAVRFDRTVETRHANS